MKSTPHLRLITRWYILYSFTDTTMSTPGKIYSGRLSPVLEKSGNKWATNSTVKCFKYKQQIFEQELLKVLVHLLPFPLVAYWRIKIIIITFSTAPLGRPGKLLRLIRWRALNYQIFRAFLI